MPFVIEDIIKRGWSKIAVFADTSGYGEAGLKDIEAALKAKNLSAVQVSRFPLGVKDLRKVCITPAAARVARQEFTR